MKIVRSGARAPAAGAGPPAFTLIELLTVVAVVALLAGLLLPALARAKSKGRTASCLSNKRQLTIAWLMYSQDNRDVLAYNSSDHVGNATWWPDAENWAYTILGWGSYQQNTNVALLLEGSVGAYVSGRASLYQCPEDWFLSAEQRALGWPRRVRSVSLGYELGDGQTAAGGRKRDNRSYNRVVNGTMRSSPFFTRLTDLVTLSPTMALAIIDEHPDSMVLPVFNAGYYLFGEVQWRRLPASYHDGGCTLSYADGHAEYKRWLVPQTRQPVAYRPWFMPEHPDIRMAGRADYEWVARRIYEPSIFQ